MKVRRRLSHIIASVLAMAILPGLLPVSVLAASDRALDITDYKATRLEDLTADDVIQYVYDGEGNKFYAPVDLSNTNTRMWLSYTVEKSQPTTLSLYELNENGCFIEYPTSSSENHYAQAELAHDRGNVDMLEPFIGTRLGTIAGICVTDNIIEAIDPNMEDLETVIWQSINHGQRMDIIGDAVKLPDSDYDVVSNDYVSDFEGQKLIIPRETPADVPIGEATEEPAPILTGELSEEPVPMPTEEPAEELTPVSTEEPLEEPTPASAEEPSEEPTPTLTEEPSEGSAPAPTKEPLEEPASASTKELSGKFILVPTEEPSEGLAPAPIEEPPEKPALAPAEELSEEPVPAPTEKPPEESAPVPTEEPSGEPAPAPTEEPSEGSIPGSE